MESTITTIEPCKLLIHCEANAEEIASKKEEVLKAFEKAPVKGFRPGHADMMAIRIQYAKQIETSLQRAMAEFCFHESVFKDALRVLGAPLFKSLSLEGKKFTCEFETHVKPDFDLIDWKTLSVPKPHSEYNTINVAEKLMQELRVQLGDALPFSETDFVQGNDNLIIDYSATCDGKKIDSLCVEGELLTIGKSPLPGWDSNLLGMTVGETREFDFNAPENGLPSLSGKTIHFTVKLNAGAKIVPCALNDDLAKKMEKKDFVELQEFVNQMAFARVSSFELMKVHEAVSKKLVAETKIDIPNFLSLSEAQYLAQQSKLDWNAMSDQDKESFLQMAENNVKLSLILDRIREDTPEAQLSEQEIFEIIKQNIAQTKTDKNIDQVMNEMQKTGYLQILMQKIKDENTLNVVVKSITLIE